MGCAKYRISQPHIYVTALSLNPYMLNSCHQCSLFWSRLVNLHPYRRVLGEDHHFLGPAVKFKNLKKPKSKVWVYLRTPRICFHQSASNTSPVQLHSQKINSFRYQFPVEGTQHILSALRLQSRKQREHSARTPSASLLSKRISLTLEMPPPSKASCELRVNPSHVPAARVADFIVVDDK